MASGKSSNELKARAISLMRQGRKEIDAEIAYVRVQLNPAHIARTTIAKHTAATLGVVFSIGILLPVLLFRRTSPTRELGDDLIPEDEARPRKSPRPSLLASMASNAAKAAAPLVARWFINTQLGRPAAPEAPTTPGETATPQEIPA